MGLLDAFRRPTSAPEATVSSKVEVSHSKESILDDSFSWHQVAPQPKELPAQTIDRLSHEVSTLREQMWSGGVSADPDAYLSPSGGGSLFFNKLSQGTRELNPLQQQRSIELAFLLYESNPLGKAIVETVRDFVLGDSAKVTSDDPDESRREDQNQIIDQFWNDYVNNFNVKLPNKVMELGLFGEQCYTVEVNPKDGHVRLGYIDPAAIQKVLVDPLNVERQLAVITYVRDAQGTSEEMWYKIICPDENPNSKWFGRLDALEGIVPGLPSVSLDSEGEETSVGGDSRVTWRNTDGKLQSHIASGSCFYFTVNRVSNATRGRTDLLSLIDWVDAFDQLLFNEMDRGLFLKAFIWDVKLEGYNDNQIEAYKKANPQPRPGAVRYHNERVEWDAVTPDLKAADSAYLADLILSYIATGARLPKTWLNGMMDVNKATAQELGTPALARLSLRQEYIKYMILQVITLVLDEAERHGIIAKRKKVRGQLRPAAWPLHITLPDLKQVNQMATAQAINNIVVGLGLAVDQGMIDLDLAREVVVMFIEQMGIKVNLSALIEKIKANPPIPVVPGQPGAGTGKLPMPPAGNTGRLSRSASGAARMSKQGQTATPNAHANGTRMMQAVDGELRTSVLEVVNDILAQAAAQAANADSSEAE